MRARLFAQVIIAEAQSFASEVEQTVLFDDRLKARAKYLHGALPIVQEYLDSEARALDREEYQPPDSKKELPCD